MPKRTYSSALEKVGIDPRQGVPVVASSLGQGVRETLCATPARVRIGPGRIEYIPVNAEEGLDEWWPAGKPAKGILQRFMKLTDASDDAIADFVRDYGVLELTPDGLPVTSPVARWSVPLLDEPWNGCAVSWEPTDAWRLYAKGAKAVFFLALNLRTAMEPIDPYAFLDELGLIRDRDGQMNHREAVTRPWKEWSAGLSPDVQTGLRDTWIHHLHMLEPETLALNLDRRMADGRRHSLRYQRQWLGTLFTDVWMQHSGLIPSMVWTDEHPYLALPIGDAVGLWEHPARPRNRLFPLLCAELVGIVCANTPFGRCKHCGQPYYPKKRNTQYCSTCRPLLKTWRTQRYRAGLKESKPPQSERGRTSTST